MSRGARQSKIQLIQGVDLANPRCPRGSQRNRHCPQPTVLLELSLNVIGFPPQPHLLSPSSVLTFDGLSNRLQEQLVKHRLSGRRRRGRKDQTHRVLVHSPYLLDELERAGAGVGDFFRDPGKRRCMGDQGFESGVEGRREGQVRVVRRQGQVMEGSFFGMIIWRRRKGG